MDANESLKRKNEDDGDEESFIGPPMPILKKKKSKYSQLQS